MLTAVAKDPVATEVLPRRYRTVFISDVHLGTRGCKADCLLDFLRHVESDYLYLVGDIVDGWRLQKRWFWPDKHGEVLRRLMARARDGTEVVYLPGNHDEAFRRLVGRSVSGVKIRQDTIHRTADGRRLLVVHGDVFDGVVTDMRWLALVGSVAYDAALSVNTWLNVARRWLGLGYWPLSAFLKEQVKAAVKFIDRYERSLAHEARRRSVCGVICGHVHKPEMRTIDGVLYYNDGDWVESCSALVEHDDGRLELLEWARQRRLDLLAARRPPAAGRSRRRAEARHQLMRILLVSDAWSPQVNGVVRTLQRVRRECEDLGHRFEVISPERFRTVPCPTYPEIRLALLPGAAVARQIDQIRPDCIHIATEGPLGLAARRWCIRRNVPFTTSYHTRFPEYVSARFPVPLAWGYRFMRWFHRPSSGVMVATGTIRDDLERRGFVNVRPWSRGVDTTLFHPGHAPALHLPKPVYLYVGRVAVEKNLGAFLDVPIARGTKLVVGDGPALAQLAAKHPEVRFVGARHGVELARHYACGDVFVFPSRTDTFGLVLLEALASGLPVAAYPVPGPLDVIGDSGCGVLDQDLGRAMAAASAIPRSRCTGYARGFAWRRCAEQFLGHLHRIDFCRRSR